MRLLSVFAVLAVIAQPPSGVFEVELSPGEGRPQFQAVANELVIREFPSSSAGIVRRLKVSKGGEIAFDEVRYRTTEPGQLQVLTPAVVIGRLLGPIRLLTRNAYYSPQFQSGEVACKEGDVIQYLQYRAEGTCFVRVGDQVVDAQPCPVHDAQVFRVVAQPKTEWWIRVALDGGPVGWVMVDEKSVKLSGRSF